jgi:hypothetical protein
MAAEDSKQLAMVSARKTTKDTYELHPVCFVLFRRF